MQKTRTEPNPGTKTIRRRWILPAVAVLSGLAAVGCMTVLTWDYVAAVRRAPGDKAKLESLELAVREDASRAPVLTAEYERQRDATLARRERTDVLAWGLIVSAALFLASAKWCVSLKGLPPPTARQIEVHRGDENGQRRMRARGRGAKTGTDASPAAIDLDFVEAVVAEQGRSQEAAIPILQRIQNHYRYLPDEALKRVCDLTEISPAQIAGVSSFYSQFRRSPVGKYVVKVCHGTACHVAGATEIDEEIRRRLRIAADTDTDPGRRFTIDKVACLGCCSLAPVLTIEDDTVGRLSPATACEALEGYERNGGP